MPGVAIAREPAEQVAADRPDGGEAGTSLRDRQGQRQTAGGAPGKAARRAGGSADRVLLCATAVVVVVVVPGPNI